MKFNDLGLDNMVSRKIEFYPIPTIKGEEVSVMPKYYMFSNKEEAIKTTLMGLFEKMCIMEGTEETCVIIALRSDNSIMFIASNNRIMRTEKMSKKKQKELLKGMLTEFAKDKEEYYVLILEEKENYFKIISNKKEEVNLGNLG